MSKKLTAEVEEVNAPRGSPSVAVCDWTILITLATAVCTGSGRYATWIDVAEFSHSRVVSHVHCSVQNEKTYGLLHAMYYRDLQRASYILFLFSRITVFAAPRLFRTMTSKRISQCIWLLWCEKTRWHIRTMPMVFELMSRRDLKVWLKKKAKSLLLSPKYLFPIFPHLPFYYTHTLVHYSGIPHFRKLYCRE